MTRIILDTAGAGTWPVPTDWNNSSWTVELIAAGANGTNQFSPGGFVGGGQGGAGGQYAIKTSSDVTPMVLTPGSTINFQVGTGGTNNTTLGGTPSAYFAWDTWFNTSSSVFAQGAWMNISGGNISHGGAYHPLGLGGGGGAPYPWAWGDGGDVTNVNAAQSANGGGGAGGPSGAGGNAGSAGGLWEGAAGGGGANGGANGGGNFNSGGGFVGLGGGNGGNNRLGAGSGNGSTGTLGGPLVYAQPGTSGGGGGGGYGRSGINTPPGGLINQWYTDGADGSTDVVWGTIYGPGSGGGGGGGGNDISGGPIGGIGGNGGQFGGGGGGSAILSGLVGLGGQGLIIITYTPVPASRPNKGLVYSKQHIIKL